MELDATDRAILACLQADARTTNVQLAQHIELSTAATLERVRKLERGGVIRGYLSGIDYGQLGFDIHAIVRVCLHAPTEENVRNFQQRMVNSSAVIACYRVAGDTDFFVHVVAHSGAAYQELIGNWFSEMSYIATVHSSFVTGITKEQGKSYQTAGENPL